MKHCAMVCCLTPAILILVWLALSPLARTLPGGMVVHGGGGAVVYGASAGQFVEPDTSSQSPVGRDEPLPTTTPGLLAELAQRAQSVSSFLQQGDLDGVWYPAIRAKDLALALEEHSGELPEAERPKLQSAVKRLTMAAWRMDAAGDVGDKQSLLSLDPSFSVAVADIQSVFGKR